ncbi:MAG: N-acetyl-gamma-glutamyl-phosphate reductase [Firmicutes bacterium HGW-Firmicutes-1]|nr:MAG: N-acetyl-gamma-glutamyl-phosphate reductase [Firmicutes bacterium HGW-Firmicutes-1]
MIKAGIVGATGYAGQELLRLLTQHSECEVKYITSRSYVDQRFSSVFGNFVKIVDDACIEKEMIELAKEVDVLFIALPHGIASANVNKDLLSMTKVIDLGADYRLEDIEIYDKWYKTVHNSADLLQEAVYGLCELNRDKIKPARLIANPGCYTTCSILGLTPLLKEGLIDKNSIIIDAKSGVSGAGRGLDIGIHYSECNESIKAYKLASHRHTPEIEQELSHAAGEEVTITFTPHLVPMNRGILVTAYATLNDFYSYEHIKNAYEKHYRDEYFVRLLPEGVFPETKWVKGSNFCDINFQVDERTNRIIVVAAIDNLIKGAAGQAIQNMNIVFGLDEKKGLEYIPMFPA